MKQTSVGENGLIWLGAGISIAEIQTGTYLAPLGMIKGILAILLGHLIGCGLLFLAGLIGGQTRQNAMATVKLSFGQRGALIFAFLNVCQLVGWTGIMIYDGALAAEQILCVGSWLWCLVIGGLIIVWLRLGINHLQKVNLVAMTTLVILTLILSWRIFAHTPVAGGQVPKLSFGAAIELVIAMPLSWLPLISDYTSKAARVTPATLVSTLAYGGVSCWMAVIGLGASLFTGQLNIAKVIFQSGMGIAGLLIVVFSTVTTTFMDAYSAGTSAHVLSAKINAPTLAVGATVVGTLSAIWLPLDNITNFLYLIGSIFAPMVAILLTDYFLLHRSVAARRFDPANLVIWLLGFLLYRWLMTLDLALGSTIPDILTVVIACLTWHWLRSRLIFK